MAGKASTSVAAPDDEDEEVSEDNELEDVIKEKIEKYFGQSSVNTGIEWVDYCCSKRDLLSVFELHSKFPSAHIYQVILEALLKANKNVDMDQLKLAIAWNKIDVPRSNYFSDDWQMRLSFIPGDIKRRQCMCFIEEANQDFSLPEGEKLCGCGYPRNEHASDVKVLPTRGVTWEYWRHTTTFPINAFGDIEFVGFGNVGKPMNKFFEQQGNDYTDKRSQMNHDEFFISYVRVDVKTPMGVMLHLLMGGGCAWELKKPNLLISVTGGTKDFTMKPWFREVFRRGLMKTALSTGAWIVTGGTNAGVMKLVGEAVRDFGLTSKGRVITIGIASWGCVQNKDQLIFADYEGKWPALYRIDSKEKEKESFLDPNHTHFILVDNGTQHKFNVEISFRAKLERAIVAQKTDTGADSVSVPICLLVLGGGPGTLQTVHLALNSGTPTVVIKGSGKTADILAYAYENAREDHSTVSDQRGAEIKETNYVLEARIIADIKDMIKTRFGESNLDTRIERVKSCCSKHDLLSVFELGSNNSAKDVDLAILKALLKAKKNVPVDQLKLVLIWNRIDVAKSEIFTNDSLWRNGMLDEVMMSAIRLNRVEFVDFFLDHDVFLKDFVTVENLTRLYNSISEVCQLYKLLRGTVKKHSDIDHRKFRLSDVGHLIQDLLGDYFQPPYPDVEQSEHEIDFILPAHHLFIWAVLMNNHMLSKLFWKKGRESSTYAALFATSILNSMKNEESGTFFTDEDLVRKLQAGANDYAQLAIGVINKCYSSNTERTHDILTQEMPHWGKSTCMLLAVQSDNKEFMAQEACQSLLNSIWMGKNLPWIKAKKRLFYRSPVVKCILNVIAYFIFLLLYSYILVVQLSKEFHFSEGILIGWVFTIFLEGIRQFLTGYAFSYKSMVTSYFNDSWNMLDVTTIVLFAIGMTLRFIDNDNCMSAARVILSINFIAFFFRILHIFSANKQLGSKLIMINRMIKDLMSFVIILIVFIVTYAISSEAVLYPNSELSWKLFYHLPRKAYWHIYGELFLDDIEGNSDCTDDPELYRDYEQLRCPSPVGKYYVPILLGVYILMTNVLLLNLLIAMFSYTFEQVQENTAKHCFLVRFRLVYEYSHRPVLPPPLNIFSLMWTLITKMCPRFKDKGVKEDEFRQVFEIKYLVDYLMPWEKDIANSCLSSTEKAERNSIITKERLEELLVKVEELQEGQDSSTMSNQKKMETLENQLIDTSKALENQLIDTTKALENQLTHTTKALEWIMSSLQENNMAAKTDRPMLPDLQK